MINSVKSNLSNPNFSASANIYTKPKILKKFYNIYDEHMLPSEQSIKMAEGILKIFSDEILVPKQSYFKLLGEPSKQLINSVKSFVKNTFGNDYKISGVFKLKDKSGNRLFLIGKEPNESLDSAMIIKNIDGSILTIKRDSWPINDYRYDTVNSLLSAKVKKKKVKKEENPKAKWSKFKKMFLDSGPIKGSQHYTKKDVIMKSP